METADDLRAVLFRTINGLTDKENPLELARAKAVAEVAQVIVNVGKLEVDYARATKKPLRSGFLIAPEEIPEETPSLPEPRPQPEEELEAIDEAQQSIQDMPDDLYLTGYRVKGIVKHTLGK